MTTPPVTPRHAPLSEISRDCMDAWVALCHSLRGKTFGGAEGMLSGQGRRTAYRSCFWYWLARMKTAFEDFFSWVDLLADWDHGRLEAFSLELIESEQLLRRYREAPPSYATFCVVASRHHLQGSIVHTLQERQHLMSNEIHHLEEAIHQAGCLRDS
ncbi:hypothetical protein LIER_18640 [Lithospermum erythrorhizon]|uniref:Uncharacterized protein n=1 Tax=Lithospermum erythrorhizon TaxID=34254 RepID=A0AAV3QFZ8_LITER